MPYTDLTLASSIRKHLLGAGLFICALMVFLIVWAGLTQISGAVISSGTIVVETNVKTIQHQEGGIVSEILVKNGDLVEAGALLLRLDNTLARARLGIVTKQLDELMATEARLIAEREKRNDIIFQKELLSRSHIPSVADSLTGQRALMIARKASIEGRINQLREQVKQLESEIKGLRIQTKAKTEEIALITEELSGLQKLLDNQFVSGNRVSAIKREKTELIGEHGALITRAARAKLTISEKEIQILQLQDEFQSEILNLLQDTRSRIGQLHEQKVATLDQLSRLNIAAPRSGYIHQLNIHTKGGVVSPGEPILLIVPEQDKLLVEAQVMPSDIDQLFQGQKATLRLPNFSRWTTPELQAEILTVSAETSRDEITGSNFYTIRLEIPESELDKLGENKLLPGMPVEALIETESRTVLSYLIKPLNDQITFAMREK